MPKKEVCKKTGKEPVFEQLTRRKCNWLCHILRRSDDSVAKQELQWTQWRPQQQRGLIQEHLNKGSGQRNVDVEASDTVGESWR